MPWRHGSKGGKGNTVTNEFQFYTQLAQGKAGESLVAKWLQSRGSRVIEAPLIVQKAGIDFLVKTPKVADWLKVEVKTDFGYHKYGKGIFVEECVERANGVFSMSWAYTSEADWFFFLTPPSSEVLIFKEPVPRGTFLSLKNYATSEKAKRARNKEANGSEYCGVGYVVPYQKMREAAFSVVTIPWEQST
jgi:hypothetical protein